MADKEIKLHENKNELKNETSNLNTMVFNITQETAFYQELCDLFKNRKNFSPKLLVQMKDLFKKHGFTLNNFLVHKLLELKFPNCVIENKEDILNKTYRQDFVQKIGKLRSNTAMDHKVHSALIKILFYCLKSSNSIQLDNVLFAIFLFNSRFNLKEIPETENSKKGVLETRFQRIIKKSLKTEDKISSSEPQYVRINKLIIDAGLADFASDFYKRIEKIYNLSLVSGSLSGAIWWIMQICDPTIKRSSLEYQIKKSKQEGKNYFSLIPHCENFIEDVDYHLFGKLFMCTGTNLNEIVMCFNQIEDN